MGGWNEKFRFDGQKVGNKKKRGTYIELNAMRYLMLLELDELLHGRQEKARQKEHKKRMKEARKRRAEAWRDEWLSEE